MEFVSFELAKAIKGKGMDNDCSYIYNDKGEICVPIYDLDDDQVKSMCPCPKIHEVLKWLREAWKIVVTPEYLFTENDEWRFNIRFISRHGEYESDEIYSSYEEAALAGIEYVIDNLI